MKKTILCFLTLLLCNQPPLEASRGHGPILRVTGDDDDNRTTPHERNSGTQQKPPSVWKRIKNYLARLKGTKATPAKAPNGAVRPIDTTTVPVGKGDSLTPKELEALKEQLHHIYLRERPKNQPDTLTKQELSKKLEETKELQTIVQASLRIKSFSTDPMTKEEADSYNAFKTAEEKLVTAIVEGKDTKLLTTETTEFNDAQIAFLKEHVETITIRFNETLKNNRFADINDTNKATNKIYAQYKAALETTELLAQNGSKDLSKLEQAISKLDKINIELINAISESAKSKTKTAKRNWKAAEKKKAEAVAAEVKKAQEKEKAAKEAKAQQETREKAIARLERDEKAEHDVTLKMVTKSKLFTATEIKEFETGGFPKLQRDKIARKLRKDALELLKPLSENPTLKLRIEILKDEHHNVNYYQLASIVHELETIITLAKDAEIELPDLSYKAPANSSEA